MGIKTNNESSDSVRFGQPDGSVRFGSGSGSVVKIFGFVRFGSKWP